MKIGATAVAAASRPWRRDDDAGISEGCGLIVLNWSSRLRRRRLRQRSRCLLSTDLLSKRSRGGWSIRGVIGPRLCSIRPCIGDFGTRLISPLLGHRQTGKAHARRDNNGGSQQTEHEPVISVPVKHERPARMRQLSNGAPPDPRSPHGTTSACQRPRHEGTHRSYRHSSRDRLSLIKSRNRQSRQSLTSEH